MTTCVWSYTEWTPYEVLRVPCNASISDIRAAFKTMALCTHPDKKPHGSEPHNSQSGTAATGASSSSPSPSSSMATTAAFGAATPVTFHVVKAASEILLDPFLRAAYDAARSHALVREVGAISDTFSLRDDFDLVATSMNGEVENEGEREAAACVYQRECRCGGGYEVVVFSDVVASPSSEHRPLRCECDSCSLVVEVVVD